MALTSGEFNPTSLVAYISETWTPKTLEEYFARAVAANHFLDLSPFAQAGSDVFHIPDVFTNAFSVQTAPDPYDATEITTDAPTTVDITLTVDTHKVSVREKVVELLGTLFGAISSQALRFA